MIILSKSTTSNLQSITILCLWGRRIFRIQTKAVVKADESIMGADVMNIGIVAMQTDGKSVVEANALIQNSNGGFDRTVVKADETVMGADVMNIGIVGMQTDGESVMEAVKSTVKAAVAGDIVMDVQMDGKSVIDARENAVDVVYADATVVGVHTDDRRAAVTWALLFWMLAQAVLVICMMQKMLWMMKQAVLMVSLIQLVGKWLCRRRVELTQMILLISHTKVLWDHYYTQVNGAGLICHILLGDSVKSWPGHRKSNGTWDWMLYGILKGLRIHFPFAYFDNTRTDLNCNSRIGTDCFLVEMRPDVYIFKK
jgi:hypothetical protein